MGLSDIGSNAKNTLMLLIAINYELMIGRMRLKYKLNTKLSMSEISTKIEQSI